jgi:hypothetical protein
MLAALRTASRRSRSASVQRRHFVDDEEGRGGRGARAARRAGPSGDGLHPPRASTDPRPLVPSRRRPRPGTARSTPPGTPERAFAGPVATQVPCGSARSTSAAMVAPAGRRVRAHQRLRLANSCALQHPAVGELEPGAGRETGPDACAWPRPRRGTVATSASPRTGSDRRSALPAGRSGAVDRRPGAGPRTLGVSYARPGLGRGLPSDLEQQPGRAPDWATSRSRLGAPRSRWPRGDRSEAYLKRRRGPGPVMQRPARSRAWVPSRGANGMPGRRPTAAAPGGARGRYTSGAVQRDGHATPTISTGPP